MFHVLLIGLLSQTLRFFIFENISLYAEWRNEKIPHPPLDAPSICCIIFHSNVYFIDGTLIAPCCNMPGRLPRLWSDDRNFFPSFNRASWNCCPEVETSPEWWRKPHTFVHDRAWRRWVPKISGLRGASESWFSWCSETNERKAQVRVCYIFLPLPSPVVKIRCT